MKYFHGNSYLVIVTLFIGASTFGTHLDASVWNFIKRPSFCSLWQTNPSGYTVVLTKEKIKLNDQDVIWKELILRDDRKKNIFADFFDDGFKDIFSDNNPPKLANSPEGIEGYNGKANQDHLDDYVREIFDKETLTQFSGYIFGKNMPVIGTWPVMEKDMTRKIFIKGQKTYAKYAAFEDFLDPKALFSSGSATKKLSVAIGNLFERRILPAVALSEYFELQNFSQKNTFRFLPFTSSNLERWNNCF